MPDQKVEGPILFDVCPAKILGAFSRIQHEVFYFPLQSGSVDEIVQTNQSLYLFLSIEKGAALGSSGYKEKI
jgi:hypothetical protein